jgi:hypothetical protein
MVWLVSINKEQLNRGSGKYWNGAICLNNSSKSFMTNYSIGNCFHSSSASCVRYPFGSFNCKSGKCFNGRNCSTSSSITKCSSKNAWSGTSCVSNGAKRSNRGTTHQIVVSNNIDK